MPDKKHIGRTAGTPNKKTVLRAQLLQDAIAKSALLPAEVAEMSPLGVLLFVMRERMAAGDREGAVLVATAAAPFCHPRLTSSDLRVTNTDAERSDSDILAELAELKRKRAAAAKVVN
jgi:hypothetical protein